MSIVNNIVFEAAIESLAGYFSQYRNISVRAYDDYGLSCYVYIQDTKTRETAKVLIHCRHHRVAYVVHYGNAARIADDQQHAIRMVESWLELL